MPRPGIEPGLPYGASKTKTGKIVLDEKPTEERYVTFGMDAERRCWQFPARFVATAFG